MGCITVSATQWGSPIASTVSTLTSVTYLANPLAVGIGKYGSSCRGLANMILCLPAWPSALPRFVPLWPGLPTSPSACFPNKGVVYNTKVPFQLALSLPVCEPTHVMLTRKRTNTLINYFLWSVVLQFHKKNWKFIERDMCTPVHVNTVPICSSRHALPLLRKASPFPAAINSMLVLGLAFYHAGSGQSQGRRQRNDHMIQLRISSHAVQPTSPKATCRPLNEQLSVTVTVNWPSHSNAFLLPWQQTAQPACKQEPLVCDARVTTSHSLSVSI